MYTEKTMARKKIKVNDMDGTGQKFKVKYDNEVVTITAYNLYFRDAVDIPTGIFCDIAIEINAAYIRGDMNDS
jgi:hypothetical protein